jgi:hypothetical protein
MLSSILVVIWNSAKIKVEARLIARANFMEGCSIVFCGVFFFF